MFEPTSPKRRDWIGTCLKQIEAAFFWNKPANISSHRVNFSGHIDPDNRKKGLKALKELLQTIVKKWPDVEFMTTRQLGELMSQGK